MAVVGFKWKHSAVICQSRINLESSVEHHEGRFCGGAGQGITTRNNRAIPRSYKAHRILLTPLTYIPVGHAVMRHHRCAIHGVARFTYGVKTTYVHNCYYFIYLNAIQSGQLKILVSYTKVMQKNVGTLKIVMVRKNSITITLEVFPQ